MKKESKSMFFGIYKRKEEEHRIQIDSLLMNKLLSKYNLISFYNENQLRTITLEVVDL